MPEVVIKHSSGMISVDAEYGNPSEEIIDRLKHSALYQRLVKRVGEDRASLLLEGHHKESLVENLDHRAVNR